MILTRGLERLTEPIVILAGVTLRVLAFNLTTVESSPREFSLGGVSACVQLAEALRRAISKLETDVISEIEGDVRDMVAELEFAAKNRIVIDFRSGKEENPPDLDTTRKKLEVQKAKAIEYVRLRFSVPLSEIDALIARARRLK